MATYNPESVWTGLTSEEHEDADEPPEIHLKQHPASPHFQKTSVRKSNEHASLLTRAIMGIGEDGHDGTLHHNATAVSSTAGQRRRSLISNISLASTADLTSDTGMTSPSRPSTPSPPGPEVTVLRLNGEPLPAPTQVSLLGAAMRVQEHRDMPVEAPRKRCIQFACGGKPNALPMTKTPSAQEAPRRPCIKFACPARPASTQNTPPSQIHSVSANARRQAKPESPSTPKRGSALMEAASAETPRQTIPRKSPATRPKFLRANSRDLNADGSQFHEFASGLAREEDWLRRENSASKAKLTINDTLTKENNIRRLATEAEIEAEEEEEEDEELENDEDDEDEDDEDADDVAVSDGEGDLADGLDDASDEDDNSDGYNTDEETGFAESDDEEEDDDLALWTPSRYTVTRVSSSLPRARPTPTEEQQSDSSNMSRKNKTPSRRASVKHVDHADDAHDLPDSTDFVCGTLDEDRPLEEAYMQGLAARRLEKLRVIPQDIDPSFPASDPENDNDGEIYNPVHHDSDEDDFFGTMEDIHHDRSRSRRRRKSEHASPRRFRSPPPKRHISPPPRARCRSPKPLFGRRPSLFKPTSPVQKLAITPRGSPRACNNVKFNLAGRPGLTYTKSLPRAGILFPQPKNRQHKARRDDIHLRGAIDIVKGLESKRQRRKEKFYQKYCNRARRGQLPERRPMPGRGAERMKELGLLMAGKKDQGNYVLSV